MPQLKPNNDKAHRVLPSVYYRLVSIEMGEISILRSIALVDVNALDHTFRDYPLTEPWNLIEPGSWM